MWNRGRGLALVIQGLAEAEAEEYVVWLGCDFWQKDFGFFHYFLKCVNDYDRDIVGSLVVVGHLRELVAGFFGALFSGESFLDRFS